MDSLDNLELLVERVCNVYKAHPETFNEVLNAAELYIEHRDGLAPPYVPFCSPHPDFTIGYCALLFDVEEEDVWTVVSYLNLATPPAGWSGALLTLAVSLTATICATFLVDPACT